MAKTEKKKHGIRDAVLRAVKEKGLSGYRLAQMLEGKVSRTAVYRFLSDGANTDVSTAEAFLDVLDLAVVSR